MLEDEDDTQKKGDDQRKGTISWRIIDYYPPKICLYGSWRFPTSKLYFIFFSYYKEKPLST